MFYNKDSDLSTSSEQALKDSLGGKGAGLYKMAKAGVNVPPFVIIPTVWCRHYQTDPIGTMLEVKNALAEIMEYLTKELGAGYTPLVSVRSGAAVSMPGMMDTILNVGLTPDNEKEWTDRLGEACFVDCLKRLLVMYGSVVHGVDRRLLEHDELSDVAAAFGRKVGDLPNAQGQLLGAIEAVFKSWDNERAVTYREIHGINHDGGTAVIVQVMVFGNHNENSGTGVMDSRDPDTGAPVVTGNYLAKGQGEQVVDGSTTVPELKDLQAYNPALHTAIVAEAAVLEMLNKEPQDIEFTVQDGQLFVLQTRASKLSDQAAVRVALDMHAEGTFTREQALKRLTPKILAGSVLPTVDPKFKNKPTFTGYGACSGVVTGTVVLTAHDAMQQKKLGKNVILVTQETDPDDIGGMHAAAGILTMSGGATSHAAVVARGMNKPCVVGLGQGLSSFAPGMTITLCGATGRVWNMQVPTVPGNHEYADRAMELLLEGCVEIGNKVPTFKRKSYVLDLSDKLLWKDEDLLAHIDSAKIMCTERLYVSLAVEGDQTLDRFHFLAYHPSGLEARRNQLRSLLDSHHDKFTLIGGKKAPMQGVNDLQSLILLDVKEHVFLSVPYDPTIQAAAQAKVLQWLIKDGADITFWNHLQEQGVSFLAKSKLMQRLMS